MRILFAGNPEIAVPALRAIAASQHVLCGVLTNPESVKGRGLHASPSAVAAAAASLEPSPALLSFARAGSEARAAVEALHPDLLVSFAYGHLFGPRFLALFPRGGINIHPSLLPRHRGPSPIPFAILGRDTGTGVSIQTLAAEMDCGDILAVHGFDLDQTETTGSLSLYAGQIAAEMLVPVLDGIEADSILALPQTGSPSYTTLISKDDGRIDWSLGCLDIDARIRAFTPWPGAWTILGDKRLSILEARPFPGDSAESLAAPGTVLGLDRSRGLMIKTIDGAMALMRLQLPARKPLTAREFVNGTRGLDGIHLGLSVTDDLRSPQ
jgi:methionyl-tRNA formyltransferase